MSNNNQNGDSGDGDGGDKPTPKHHDIALAINSLAGKYETTESNRAKHDQKTLFWARIAGCGVIAYSLLTVVITAAAIFAAIYSGQQAAATREANTVVQRPFVTFTGLRIDQQNLGNPGLPYLWFTVLAQNSGNTPTKNMRYFVDSSGAEPSDPEELYRHPSGTVQLRRITLPPHFNGPLSLAENGIPLNSFKSMVEQRRVYFVYGATHYWDRFAESKEHISKFCYWVGASINDDNQPAWSHCLFWNCADDDCDADKKEYEQALAKAKSQPK